MRRDPVARRPNYGFEKRQRELRKQKRKAEKEARKRGEDEAGAAPDGDEAVATPAESGTSDRE
jgi:hypothetical protein